MHHLRQQLKEATLSQQEAQAQVSVCPLPACTGVPVEAARFREALWEDFLYGSPWLCELSHGFRCADGDLKKQYGGVRDGRFGRVEWPG